MRASAQEDAAQRGLRDYDCAATIQTELHKGSPANILE